MNHLSLNMRSRLSAMFLLGLVLMPRGVSQVPANFSANSATATSATSSVAANASASFSTSTSMISLSSSSGSGSKASMDALASSQARSSRLSSQPMSRLSSSAVSSAVANLYSAGNQGTLSSSESRSSHKSTGTTRIVVAPSTTLGVIGTGVRPPSGVGMGLRSGLVSSFSPSSLSSSRLSGGSGYTSPTSTAASSSSFPPSKSLGSHGRTSKLKKQSLRRQLGLSERRTLHEQLKDQLSNDSPQQ